MPEEKDIFEDVFGEDKEKANAEKAKAAEEIRQEEKPVKVFGNPDDVKQEENENEIPKKDGLRFLKIQW